MSFIHDTRGGINEYIRKNYGTLSKFCKDRKVGQGKLWKFLNEYTENGCAGPTGINSIALGEILDFIGAKIVFPADNKSRVKNVVFSNIIKTVAGDATPPVVPEDYKAVPMMDMASVSGSGLHRDENIRSWMVVHALHPSVRLRSNLVVTEVGRGQTSMVPTLHPLDSVLIDLDDRNTGAGTGMFLVREPDSPASIRRVSINVRSGKTHLVYCGDNTVEYPPSMYVLEEDYQSDMDMAIVGKVIWAWTDMTQK